MTRRPPRSTRTYTRFPYTTLFRSPVSRSPPRGGLGAPAGASRMSHVTNPARAPGLWAGPFPTPAAAGGEPGLELAGDLFDLVALDLFADLDVGVVLEGHAALVDRSEERRVGKGCCRTCKFRLAPDN